MCILGDGINMEIKDEIKELRESTGMNRKEFCEYFGIPYRTVTEWERGTRKMPDYVFRLLAYRIKMEQIYNPQFKVFESEHFKKQVGLLTFTPSISEWINKTNAIGLCVKRGKYGGTYAHKDIAFEL